MMVLNPSLWYATFQRANTQGSPYANAGITPAVARPVSQGNQPQLSQRPNPFLRGLAQSMISEGGSTAPVQSPFEAIARGLTGAAGGYLAGQQNEAQQVQDDARNAALANVFGLSPEEAKALPVEAYGQVAQMRTAEAANEVAQREAEAKRARETIKDERDLRKEYRDASKTFIEQRDSYQRLLASAEQPTGAGDIALLVSYMKVLDPGSVVREGEFATAENAGGVPARLRGFYNRIVSGQRLTPAQRADFVARGGNLYASALDIQRGREGLYGNLAEQYDMDRDRVVPDLVRGVEPISVEEALTMASGAPMVAPDTTPGLQDVVGAVTAGVGGEETAPAAIAAPTNQAEYDAIPSGSSYQHPDDPIGTLRVKP